MIMYKELEEMLEARTREVDRGLKRYDESVIKQRKIIQELKQIIENCITHCKCNNVDTPRFMEMATKHRSRYK